MPRICVTLLTEVRHRSLLKLDVVRTVRRVAIGTVFVHGLVFPQEGAALVGFNFFPYMGDPHAGFLPPDTSDPLSAKMIERLQFIADTFGARGIEVAFETGQETAPVLVEFLQKLGRKNVGVNFDPANIILYDHGDPIEALRTLGPWLKQIHIKEGKRPRTPGIWGEEVVAGTGEVAWPEFFATLRALNFTGWCCIEREAGTARVEDIRAARELVERVG